MSNHAPRQPVKNLLCALHENFGKNVSNIGEDAIPILDIIDLNSRTISEIRTVLKTADFCGSEGQKNICAELLDEVFTDFSIAMYLCTIGLVVPARMSIRRAFELGLASVYMWDLPHEYWGWRNKDQDLSFSAMVAHLNSVGYSAYLAHVQGQESALKICDQDKFQSLYRELSNTVHGKIAGLPPLSPERFSPEKNGLAKHLKLITDAQQAVTSLLYGRFSGLQARIEIALPQIKRT